MTATRPLGQLDVYAGRILAVTTAHDMNAVAAEIATDRSIPDNDRARLQLLFRSRMRELWPNNYRRRT